MMSEKYQREQAELENRIKEYEYELDRQRADMTNAEIFIDNIKEYAEITELTAPLLNRLIDKITVAEREMVDGECIQRICIYYKFVGCLEETTLHTRRIVKFVRQLAADMTARASK